MKNTTRISLSRKGFDSSTGGRGSPVLDGRFISLPIPEAGSGLFYEQLKLEGLGPDFLSILRQLGANQYSECHMDPNLNPDMYGLNRMEGWEPVFGQDGNAVSHLLNSGFKPGDIFLFFGRFREAQTKNDQFIWTGKKDFHAIYGFMEVGEIVNIRNDLNVDHIKRYGSHPHIAKRNTVLYSDKSTLFIPAQKSIHSFTKTYGIFNFHRELVLTEEGHDLVNWQFPAAFRSKNFSTLGNIDRSGIVRAPGRGQEMVGIADKKIIDWIRRIIQNHT